MHTGIQQVVIFIYTIKTDHTVKSEKQSQIREGRMTGK